MTAESHDRGHFTRGRGISDSEGHSPLQNKGSSKNNDIIANIQHLLCARSCGKHFICIPSL